MGWADEIPGNPVLIGFRPRGFFQTAEGLHRALVLRGGNAPQGPSLQPHLMENSLRGTGPSHLQLEGKRVAAFIWEESGVSS